MSDELYEVAFSGQIVDGASLEQVKAKVAAIFKADDTKLAQLFSGKRIVIKKNIDQATANKYKKALNNAGAQCEVQSLRVEVAEKTPKQVVQEKKAEDVVKPVSRAAPAVATSAADIPPAPQTAPLGVDAGDIADLGASLAPVGSNMQDGSGAVAAADIDVSGLDVAPPGSDLGQVRKEELLEQPDTSGLSLED